MTDSRRKGRRFENEVVGVLRANGYPADRISEAGLPGPDIECFGGRVGEAKTRATLEDSDGARLVIRGLEDVQVFFMKQDRGPIIISMELGEFFDIQEWWLEEKLSQIGDTFTLASGGEQPPL